MGRAASPSPKPYFRPAPPRILAHRGLAARGPEVVAPENTLLAFAAALAAGATHVETDVHASRDGVAMIAHDPDLRRVAGLDGRVEERTARELEGLDLGERQGMPTLARALDAFPDARFNIDVKTAAAVGPVVEAVVAARASHRVLITSFSGRRTRAVARRLPGVATSAGTVRVALAVLVARVAPSAVLRAVLSPVDALQVPERCGPVRLVDARTVRRFRAAGVEVHVWVVNDPADMRRLLALGVDGLVTDRTDLAVAVVR